MKNWFSFRPQILLVIFSLLALFVLNVYFSQVLLSTNINLINIVNKTKNINDDIAKLRIELSEKTAVQKIIVQAEKLGFSELQQVLYLNDNEALAKK